MVRYEIVKQTTLVERKIGKHRYARTNIDVTLPETLIGKKAIVKVTIYVDEEPNKVVEAAEKAEAAPEVQKAHKIKDLECSGDNNGCMTLEKAVEIIKKRILSNPETFAKADGKDEALAILALVMRVEDELAASPDAGKEGYKAKEAYAKIKEVLSK